MHLALCTAHRDIFCALRRSLSAQVVVPLRSSATMAADGPSTVEYQQATAEDLILCLNSVHSSALKSLQGAPAADGTVRHVQIPLCFLLAQRDRSVGAPQPAVQVDPENLSEAFRLQIVKDWDDQGSHGRQLFLRSAVNESLWAQWMRSRADHLEIRFYEHFHTTRAAAGPAVTALVSTGLANADVHNAFQARVTNANINRHEVILQRLDALASLAADGTDSLLRELCASFDGNLPTGARHTFHS